MTAEIKFLVGSSNCLQRRIYLFGAPLSAVPSDPGLRLELRHVAGSCPLPPSLSANEWATERRAAVLVMRLPMQPASY